MKKAAIYFFFSFGVIACNSHQENKQENIPTSKLEVLTELSEEKDTVKVEKKVEEAKSESNDNADLRVSKNSKPLLIARGSEPGWYAEFFANRLRLLMDYGSDSIILEKDFSGINNDKTYSAAMVENNSENKKHPSIALAISITDKACTEEGSGEKREKTISIKYNNKTYKGCATANVN